LWVVVAEGFQARGDRGGRVIIDSGELALKLIQGAGYPHNHYYPTAVQMEDRPSLYVHPNGCNASAKSSIGESTK
jgi:hypothetical protein